MKLIVENLRSFAGRHEIPLKPLTILVGENSSGKTTLLAALSAMFSPASNFPSRPAFNEPPFDIGSYDTIATYKGGKYGRAKHFGLGFEDEEHDEKVFATYVSRLGQPTLSDFTLTRQDGSVSVRMDGQTIRGELRAPNIVSQSPYQFSIANQPMEIVFGLSSFAHVVYSALWQDTKLREELGGRFREVLHYAAVRGAIAAFSIAPVRTKPKRTYDEISDEFRPEGDHIPLILSHVFGVGATPRQRDLLRQYLDKFGNNSGLFTRMRVKKLGKSPSDPFQILVAVAGRPFNLPDVGYGVSQSLPIVVDSVLRPEAKMLLLQQPEVHLHPRAQAALGSFFVDLVASHNKRFVIETHSDFFVDRVRQEVARGSLNPAAVQVIFLSRKNAMSKVYVLEIDPAGNIVGAPRSYREFFLKEEMNLLIPDRTNVRDR